MSSVLMRVSSGGGKTCRRRRQRRRRRQQGLLVEARPPSPGTPEKPLDAQKTQRTTRRPVPSAPQ